MKIALVLESFDPHCGDVEASAFELARHLLRLQHEVHVVAEGFSKEGLEVPIVPHRLRAVRSPLRRDTAAAGAIRSLDADVVHAMGITSCGHVLTPPAGSPIGMWQRQVAGAAWWRRPLERLVHGCLPRHRQQAELARRQLDASDAIVVAPSEIVAADYRSLHGVAADRVRVVHPGVDIKKYTPHIRKLRRETTRKKLGVEAKDLLLLAVVDKCEQADWSLAFRAMRRLIGKRVPVQLIIAAKRQAAPRKKLADRFGVAPRVRVVDQPDRIPYYAAADVLLLPALCAPFSGAVLEAAACGLPCIIAGQNGAADLMTEDVDSHILSRRSAADLAGRIELFLDSAHRERMGLAARRTAMRYPLDRSLDKIVEIYQEIAESQQQARRDGVILGLPRGQERNMLARRAA